MKPNIVCTFMFSEPHEQEIFWLKLNVESAFIKEWVIIEGGYTFQGKHKPMCLEEILKQERFKPFLSKIHLIQLNRNYNFEYEIGFKELLKRKVKRYLNKHWNKNYNLVPYAENASFHAEIIQRQACVEYLKLHYTSEDIVIPCDADEIVDLNEGKAEKFYSLCEQHPELFYIRRKIFCYDFDNLTSRIRYIAVARLRDLLSGKHSVHSIVHPHYKKRNIVNTPETYVFEYTFCFGREAILRKLQSFSHVSDVDEEILAFALKNNIVMIDPSKIDECFLQDSESFYEKVSLTSDTAPEFLRNNVKYFLTNIVCPDYKNYRIINNLKS